MSTALSKAAPLKAEIRLAQAVSQFEAELASDQKAAFRSQRSQAYQAPPTAQDVMSFTAKIDRETKNKSGGGRCFGPRLTNVLQAVQQFAALGDVVFGGSQNIIACGVWTLVRMSLLSLVNYSSYMDKLSTLLMVAGRSAPRYQKMALLYTRSRILRTSLSEYFIVIVQLCHHMLKTANRTKIGQMVSSLSDSALKSYETDLIRWASAVKEEADLLLSENIDDQGTRVKLLLKLSESEAYRQKLKIHCQILDSFSKYDYETTWKELRKVGNTGLLRATPKYASWKSELSSSTLLWRGKLGAGKSVLMANIVDDLNLHVAGSSVPVAYFFCRHDIAESLKARTVIGSFTRQILRPFPDLGTQDTIGETIPIPDCDRILSVLRTTLPSSFGAYFVLDGLDECPEKERFTILAQLRTLQQIFGLLVCLSSRSDASSAPWLVPSMTINSQMVTISDDNPDISCFIRSQLEYSIKTGALKVGDPAIVFEIEDALLQGSQGMFLWVALQIEALYISKTDDAIRKALEDLPADLPETFNRIIQRSGEAGSEYRIRIFKLIVAAFRPLTVDETREALSVVPGVTTWNPAHVINDVYSALACCGSLISIDEEALTVKLIHHSVRQFLLGQFSSSQAAFFNADCAHQAMGEINITYLNYGVFDTSLSTTVIPDIAAGGSPSRIVGSMDTIGLVQSLALKYLRSRKQPAYNMGMPLAEAAMKHPARNIDRLFFYDYAKLHWLDHVMFVPVTRQVTDELVKVINLHPSSEYIGHCPNGERSLLCWASKFGYEEILRALLDTGASPEIRNDFDMTPLYLAVSAGHLDIVKTLIDRGADVDFKSKNGMTPLMVAIRMQNQSMVSLLLSHGAKPHSVSNHEESQQLPNILPSSIQRMIHDLLSAGFEVYGNFFRRELPLVLAITAENSALIEILLSYGAKMGQSVVETDFNALEFAIFFCEHTTAFDTLMAKGAGFNPSSLSLAIKNRNLDMVKKFMKHMAMVGESLLEPENDEGNKPLRLAIWHHHVDIVDILIKHGAELNPPEGSEDPSPLMEAILAGDKQIMGLLIKRGADVNFRDSRGRTPLSLAVERGDLGIMDSLTSSRDFDPTKINCYDEEAPPLVTSRLRNADVISELLKLGASPDIMDVAGYTPLRHAIEASNPTVVKLLLEHGANPNLKTVNTPVVTPLGQAIFAGSFEIVKLLVAHGVRAGPIADTWSRSASQLAAINGHAKIAHYLEEHGL
ncbi:ankyrin repeat-containing domain protein [Rhypophila decipiens]|uniref:Ankyrin repeat-containing domain protein n=1 Tax=Rhypophila decipiens TaxID=261697 RepID=A0AAN6YHC5_9PEZI|nr:ankyrin repeat-containing domain protein [Rhypophila decipiens]